MGELELIVYGASDDLLELEGVVVEEFGNYTGNSDTGGRLLIYEHGNDVPTLAIVPVYRGFWAFAVGPGPIDDYDELPDWGIRREWGTLVPYSETLIIDVPDGVKLVFVNKDGDRYEV